MLVVDANVIVTALGDDGPQGDRVRLRLAGEDLAAPELIDIEVLSAWRRLLSQDKRAATSIQLLKQLRLLRVSCQPLAERCWELRHNVSSYDASYVALAEWMGATLVTNDARLSRATGIRCEVELIS